MKLFRKHKLRWKRKLLILLTLTVLIISVAASFSKPETAAQANGQTNGCEITWDDKNLKTLKLSQRQTEAVTTIYRVVKEVGMDSYATIIAIATAKQESDLNATTATDEPNSDGDMGIFQQRVYVGWYAKGKTIAENKTILKDMAYQTKVFLQGINTTSKGRIKGLKDYPYHNMSVAAAAQAVQTSAFPEAYSKWEAMAREITKKLETSTNKILCNSTTTDNNIAKINPNTECPPSKLNSEEKLTPTAIHLLRCIKKHFPKIQDIGGWYNGGKTSDHTTGNAIDVMIPNWQTQDGINLGTQIANWAKTNAKTLNIKYVIWRKQIWNPLRNNEGWRQCGSAAATCYSGNDPNGAHLNHVHISVNH